jgi:hypothetical protein
MAPAHVKQGGLEARRRLKSCPTLQHSSTSEVKLKIRRSFSGARYEARQEHEPRSLYWPSQELPGGRRERGELHSGCAVQRLTLHYALLIRVVLCGTKLVETSVPLYRQK